MVHGPFKLLRIQIVTIGSVHSHCKYKRDVEEDASGLIYMVMKWRQESNRINPGTDYIKSSAVNFWDVLRATGGTTCAY